MKIGNVITFILIVAILLTPWIFDIGEWVGDENTAYGLTCENSKTKLKSCPKSKYKWFYKTYTAMPVAQRVLYPVILKTKISTIQSIKGSCNVIDRNNWTCSNKKYSFVMTGGDYFELVNAKKSKYIEYFPKYLWLIKGNLNSFKALF